MKKSIILFVSAILLVGCSEKDISENSIISEAPEIKTDVRTETVSPTEQTSEESTEPVTDAKEIELPPNAISIEMADSLLRERLENGGIMFDDEHRLSYEYTDLFDSKPCYVFRSFDDFDDHRATSAYYAVNVRTGDCYDTNSLTELTPLFYRFEITDSGVDVYRKNGEFVQSIDIDSEWFYEAYQKRTSFSSPYDLVTMNDYDFDGCDDLSVQTYLGAYQPLCRYYRFNTDTQLFEEWDKLNQLTYPVTGIDREAQTFSVFTKSGAINSNETVYKWTDGDPVPVSRATRYNEGAEIYTDHFEYDENGNETLTKRERMILDENGQWQDEAVKIEIE